MKTVIASSLVLIVAAIALVSIPSATSQQFTTSTNFLTSTQTQTLTQYYQTSETITASNVGALSTIASATSAYLTTVTTYGEQPATSSQETCYVAPIEFNSIGTTVHLHYTASEAVSAFILNQSEVNTWNQKAGSTSTCTLYPNGIIAGYDASTGQYIFAKPLPYLWTGAALGSTSGDAYLSLPVSGNPYLLLILAVEPYSPPVATVTLDPVSTVSSTTIASTGFTQSTLTDTTTLTTATTLEIPFTQTYGNWIVPAVIGVLAIAVLFFALRKRTTHSPKQATLTQFVKAPTSCIKCGAELPPSSDFCNKCGTKQH